MYYGPDIIISSGWRLEGISKERMGIIMNIPLAAANAVGTISNTYMVERLGRRYVLLRFLPGACVSLLLVSLGMYLSIFNEDEKIKWYGQILFMICTISYLIFFAFCLSGTPFVINSEIYPIHLIGTAAAFSTTVNWFANFIVASIFLTSMETKAGKVYTFDILAFFCLVAWLFTYFMIPETKGKRITENLKAILG